MENNSPCRAGNAHEDRERALPNIGPARALAIQSVFFSEYRSQPTIGAWAVLNALPHSKRAAKLLLMLNQAPQTLAIIVPAYKARFLVKTLASIARQHSTNTRLYIFDDASPEPIETITREALATCPIPWSYVRFEQNVGGRSLCEHYDRCIREITEDWVWVFSDDDVMEPGCVESFFASLPPNGTRHEVYCFDSVEIDSEDRIISIHPPLAEWESWKQHTYLVFRGCRFVPQQAVVFSRASFQKLGGFVPFPLAWGSDFATVIVLAAETGIKRIAGAKVRFRSSGENISTTNDSRRSAQKLQALMQLIAWLFRQLEKSGDANFPLADETIRKLSTLWFKRQLVALHIWYSPKECIQIARFLQNTCGESYGKSLLRMLALNLGMVWHTIRIRIRLAPRASHSAPRES